MKTNLALSLATAAALAISFSSCSGSSGGGTTGALVGNVLDSSDPVSGATITVEELGVTTSTDSNGFFRLENLPGGTYTIEVDGGVVFDPDDNSQRLARKAVIEFPSIQIGNGDTTLNGRPIFLPTLSEGVQIDTMGTTSAVIPAGTVIGSNEVGATLVFEEDTTVTFASASDTTVSVSRVPIEAIPMSLPDGQISSSIVTLQPPGTTFEPAVRVLFPNADELPAGTTGVALYRFDHDAGDWTQFGTGTVDASGETIVSDAGSGLDEAGWNGPTTATVGFTTIRGRVVAAENTSVGLENVLCTTVNGLQATTDAEGNFEIANVPIPRVGFATLVNAAPIGKNSGFEPKNSDSTIAVLGGTTEVGDIALDPDPVDTTPPTIVSVSPADTTADVADSSVVVVEFSEAVNRGSITPESFALTFGNTTIPGTFAVNGSTVTFLPEDPLPLASVATVALSTAIQDANGNALENPFQSNFQTATDASGAMDPTITVAGTIAARQGVPEQFSATFLDGSGAPVPGIDFTWTTTDPSIATVSSTGFVTPRAPGTVTITAAASDVSGTLDVIVTPAAVASVVVAPESSTLVTGGLGQLFATPRDVLGADIDNLAFAWSSDDTDVATVSPSGVVTAVSAGVATISATTNSVTGTATITVVNLASVASIVLTPSAIDLDLGASTQLAAVARDMTDATIPGVPFTWSSSNDAVATVTSLGRVTAVAAGEATITATAGAVSSNATVNIAQPTTLTVVVTGGKNADDPRSGVRVLRHDAETGAFVAEMTTNSLGVASFGDIGATETTFTVYDSTFGSLVSLVGVSTGTFRVSVPGAASAAATFDVTLQNADMQATSGGLGLGTFGETDLYFTSISGGMGTIAGVEAERLQADGRFSMLALVPNGMSSTAGWVLDVLPSDVHATNVAIDVSTPFAAVPFSADATVFFEGFRLHRHGAIFEADGLEKPAFGTSGSFGLPPMPGVGSYEVEFGIDSKQDFTASASVTRIFHGAMPTSVSIAAPTFAVDTVGYDGMAGTLSWTTSGAGLTGVDVAIVSLDFGSIFATGGEGVAGVEWTALVEPSSTSFTKLGLPMDLESLTASTPFGEVELIDVDNVAGFGAVMNRLQSVGGNPARIGTTANSIRSAGRELTFN